MRRPSAWVATTTHQTVNVPMPPMIDSSGKDLPRNGMLSGVRNGRRSSGSLIRRATTEMCAAVNEIMAPKA